MTCRGSSSHGLTVETIDFNLINCQCQVFLHVETVCILISWLLKNPADQDAHCFARESSVVNGIGQKQMRRSNLFSNTKVNVSSFHLYSEESRFLLEYAIYMAPSTFKLVTYLLLSLFFI